jgi:arylsulfatase A-like enzyme
MLSDDMGWGQPGFQGGKVVPTPNLDRLAKEGVSLTQFYVQPVCTPTRACFLTGRYAFRTGTVIRFTANDTAGMLLDERTLADALKEAGYFTAIVGKWHLGEWKKEHLPMQRGFDYQYGHYSASIDAFTHKRGEVLDWHRNEQPVIEQGYCTYLIANEVDRLLSKHDRSKPFFFYVPFHAVHAPHQAPAEMLKKYEHLGRRGKQRAQLASMDIAIGRILKSLDKNGQRANTLVIFFNDNGGPSGVANLPYRGVKCAYHEGGIRVACLWSWPGKFKGGMVVDELLHVVDMYPTLIKLAGASLKQKLPIDGRDIWPTLTQGKPSPRKEIAHGLKVIRMGDWKYIAGDAKYYRWSADEAQLYNIKEDPYEKNNLIDKYPEKVKMMKEELAYYAKQARPAEKKSKIPNFPVAVYGEQENNAWKLRVEN